MKELDELLPHSDSYSPVTGHFWLAVGLIVGAALLIVVLGIVWAKYFRAENNRRRSARSTTIMGAQTEGEAQRGRRRERYTRRNPTLAERGGLPPIREDYDAPAPPPPAGDLTS